MHQFNENMAKKYNIEIATLFEHFVFWYTTNKNNGSNFYDGEYWTYSSMEGFQKTFSYFTIRQIRYSLDKMKDLGLLKSGNYNTTAFDRTTWYTLGEVGHRILAQRNAPLPDIDDLPTQTKETIEPEEPKQKQRAQTTNKQKEEWFKEFWASYPRKVAKPLAESSFRKKCVDEVTFCDIMKSLDRHKQTEQWKDVKYVCHPSTWLNQMRWQDEIALPAQTETTEPPITKEVNDFDWR